MKKLTSILLIALMAFSLAACVNDEANTPEVANDGAIAPDMTTQEPVAPLPGDENMGETEGGTPVIESDE